MFEVMLFVAPAAIRTVKHFSVHVLLEVRPEVAVERGQRVPIIWDVQVSCTHSLANFLQAGTAIGFNEGSSNTIVTMLAVERDLRAPLCVPERLCCSGLAVGNVHVRSGIRSMPRTIWIASC